MLPYCEDERAEWRPAVMTGSGALKPDGRLWPGAGVWDVLLWREAGSTFVHVRLYSGGQVVVSQGMAGVDPLPAFDFDDEWIDSTLAAQQFRSAMRDEPLSTGHSLYMQLRLVENTGLFWEVRSTELDRATQMQTQWSVAADAITGDVVAQTKRRDRNGTCIEYLQRDRQSGNLWVAVDATPAGSSKREFLN
jgi:hypothetical protein